MKLIALALATFVTISLSAQELSIVPEPVSVNLNKGKFQISSSTVITVDDEAQRQNAIFLRDYLDQYYGIRPEINTGNSEGNISLVTRRFIRAPTTHGYTLSATPEGINIEGDTYTGVFYGIQTLIQLLPVDQTKNVTIPSVTIIDSPRFRYRGMHLDVVRHFFPVEFVKKYIDYLALHKFNYFHWHLTDDQGWRIEIKKYPELTRTGAWRNGTIIGRYPGRGNDNIPYGGFYTQEEVKEIVQYAEDRHITVIPEIEMPGHASAAIAAYPWLSCFPDKTTKSPTALSEASQKINGKYVQETWGVFDDVFCAGKETTFRFLEGVLDEVLELFPSRYIHAGGDECPKTHWKQCPNCQNRIREEGLKNEHELQSWFIQRMEKYLNARGRILIGWDEILEGGLAPNAVVMSWRGEKGGIEAATAGHDVIMTPQKPVYFDHTQSTQDDSVTIGGFNPIEAVYNYEPVPEQLHKSRAHHVMGAQANVWAEYIHYPSRVEYTIFPRMSALSEVLWSPSKKRDWNNFEKKIPSLFSRYELWGAHYSTAYFDIRTAIKPAAGNKGLLVELSTRDKDGRLLYGIAGQHLAKNYEKPIHITDSASITALYYSGSRLMDSTTFDLYVNKATGKKITLATKPSRTYSGDGAFTLVDGIQNTLALARTREFLGFNGDHLSAVIDLGASTTIHSVEAHFLDQKPSWIHPPLGMEVSVSTDGKNFRKLPATVSPASDLLRLDFKPIKARYLRIKVLNHGTIGEGQPGSGNKAWLFVDELVVQ